MEFKVVLLICFSVVVVALAVFLGFKRRGQKTAALVLDPQKNFAFQVKSLLFNTSKKLSEVIPDLEEVLLTADVGIEATEDLVQRVVNHPKIQSTEQAYDFLKSEIQTVLKPEKKFEIAAENKPSVIYLVGVNGVGKTTTIGKLACQYKNQGLKVLLVAADTFRAAAVEQLRLWSEKNGVEFFGGLAQADPSSVVVDGLQMAQSKNCDVVLVDTAGRLQTKSNLMGELQKMTRMSQKVVGRDPDEIFLVVDAMTGQNGFSQAKIFIEAVPLTGVILTKYDATSKGGIIISIVKDTGLPIRYVGFGEGIEDLKPFDAAEFVTKIFG